MDDEALADFQAALLSLLAEEIDADEARARLLHDPAFSAHRAWIERFEPRSIDVALELVKKWGRRQGA